MKDLIIGSISNLNWSQCLHWVNSINQSGFDGHKIVCMFGEDKDSLVKRFNENGFSVFKIRALELHENVCAARFEVYYKILETLSDVRNVISTDVTDVVFQKNPSEYLKHFNNDFIVASSENIKYKDEAWGANNLNLSFSELAYVRMQDSIIYNAGVMAGSYSIMKELFFAISSMCANRYQHIEGGGGPDQAAYNIMLNLTPFKQITNSISHDSGWACQVGTVADPRKDYSSFNIDPPPSIDSEGTVRTSKGVEYFIVHQYNRNPSWDNLIKRKFS